MVLHNTAQVSWAHQALEVPSKAGCDWNWSSSSSGENKTASSGESQVEQPVEAFSLFKDEKQETRKAGSFKEGWGGLSDPLGSRPAAVPGHCRSRCETDTCGLGPQLGVSTAVNDNTNRPQHLLLPTQASCRLPTRVYVLAANAAAPSLGPCGLSLQRNTSQRLQ